MLGESREVISDGFFMSEIDGCVGFCVEVPPRSPLASGEVAPISLTSAVLILKMGYMRSSHSTGLNALVCPWNRSERSTKFVCDINCCPEP